MRTPTTGKLPPTKMQLKYISSICSLYGIDFGGSTRDDACDFLSEYGYRYEVDTGDGWCAENGYS